MADLESKNINVVIIDDDDTYRSVLSRSLSKQNCLVADFEEPSSALVYISNQQSPTILLDLKLEHDSGLRWISKIKEANPNCKVILLTGYASISTAVEAIKLGADDYLPKPITAREILAHISQASSNDEVKIADKPMSVDRLEWEHIQKILLDNDGNISASARALGMHRRTLQRKLAKKPVRS